MNCARAPQTHSGERQGAASILSTDKTQRCIDRNFNPVTTSYAVDLAVNKYGANIVSDIQELSFGEIEQVGGGAIGGAIAGFLIGSIAGGMFYDMVKAVARGDAQGDLPDMGFH
jgi:hypothetical protein